MGALCAARDDDEGAGDDDEAAGASCAEGCHADALADESCCVSGAALSEGADWLAWGEASANGDDSRKAVVEVSSVRGCASGPTYRKKPLKLGKAKELRMMPSDWYLQLQRSLDPKAETRIVQCRLLPPRSPNCPPDPGLHRSVPLGA